MSSWCQLLVKVGGVSWPANRLSNMQSKDFHTKVAQSKVNCLVDVIEPNVLFWAYLKTLQAIDTLGFPKICLEIQLKPCTNELLIGKLQHITNKVVYKFCQFKKQQFS